MEFLKSYKHQVDEMCVFFLSRPIQFGFQMKARDWRMHFILISLRSEGRGEKRIKFSQHDGQRSRRGNGSGRTCSNDPSLYHGSACPRHGGEQMFWWRELWWVALHHDFILTLLFIWTAFFPSIYNIPWYHISFNWVKLFSSICVTRFSWSSEGKQIHTNEVIELQAHFKHLLGQRSPMCNPHYEQKWTWDTVQWKW